MNKLIDLVVTAWSNKHTSGAAIALFVATVIGILWPQYKTQADDIARAAIVYGLFRAGDASASYTKPPTTSIERPQNQNENRIC